MESKSGLSFACRCSEEGKAQCDEIKQWAIDWLNKDRTDADVITYGTNKENLVDRIVWALSWNYHAEITGILNDQWSAVTSSTYDSIEVDGKYQKVDPPNFSTYIQCDDVIDGFAFTLRTYFEKYGNKRGWDT